MSMLFCFLFFYVVCHICQDDCTGVNREQRESKWILCLISQHQEVIELVFKKP